MPRRVNGLDRFAAKLNGVAILQLPRGGLNAATCGHCRLRAGVLDQLPGGGNVIGVGVRLNNPAEAAGKVMKKYRNALRELAK